MGIKLWAPHTAQLWAPSKIAGIVPWSNFGLLHRGAYISGMLYHSPPGLSFFVFAKPAAQQQPKLSGLSPRDSARVSSRSRSCSRRVYDSEEAQVTSLTGNRARQAYHPEQAQAPKTSKNRSSTSFATRRLIYRKHAGPTAQQESETWGHQSQTN